MSRNLKDIRKCPFCGIDPTVSTEVGNIRKGDHTITNDYITVKWRIMCGNCGNGFDFHDVEMPELHRLTEKGTFEFDPDHSFDNLGTMQDLWNGITKKEEDKYI